MRGVISFTGSDENNAYIPMTFNIRDIQLEKGLPIAFSLSRSLFHRRCLQNLVAAVIPVAALMRTR